MEEGSVFTGVCVFMGGGLPLKGGWSAFRLEGVCLQTNGLSPIGSAFRDKAIKADPHPRYGQQAVVTHPTGWILVANTSVLTTVPSKNGKENKTCIYSPTAYGVHFLTCLF